MGEASEVPMTAFRLTEEPTGLSELEPLDWDLRGWENGPGEFKGVGGSVLGSASRLMLMRLEPGARPPQHRITPCLAVLLEGELTVSGSGGAPADLRPGDSVLVETGPLGRWELGNPGADTALLAIIQMSPSPEASTPR